MCDVKTKSNNAVQQTSLAKFHYAVWVADLVADLVSDLSVADRFELSQRVEIARTWSQTGSDHIPLRYVALRPSRESRATSSRAVRRPARELVANWTA